MRKSLNVLVILFLVGGAFYLFFVGIGTGQPSQKEEHIPISQEEKTPVNPSIPPTAKSESIEGGEKNSSRMPVGTNAWLRWLRALPQEEQSKILEKIEATMYPGETSTEDWKAAKVVVGPRGKGDLFPCTVLTNYKPLLRPREGLGVVGLQFLISRNQNSILTSIWGSNTKGALLVDWSNQKVVPAFGMDNLSGTGLSPQDVSYGLNILGGNGHIGFAGATFPWRKDYRAYPLVVRKDETIWFGTVYRDEPRELESVICVSPKPPQILGEIKLPSSKTTVWCLFDEKQKVLFVVEHEWNWIAMIDTSKPLEGKAVQSLPDQAENTGGK